MKTLWAVALIAALALAGCVQDRGSNQEPSQEQGDTRQQSLESLCQSAPAAWCQAHMDCATQALWTSVDGCVAEVGQTCQQLMDSFVASYEAGDVTLEEGAIEGCHQELDALACGQWSADEFAAPASSACAWWVGQPGESLDIPDPGVDEGDEYEDEYDCEDKDGEPCEEACEDKDGEPCQEDEGDKPEDEYEWDGGEEDEDESDEEDEDESDEEDEWEEDCKDGDPCHEDEEDEEDDD